MQRERDGNRHRGAMRLDQGQTQDEEVDRLQPADDRVSSCLGHLVKAKPATLQPGLSDAHPSSYLGLSASWARLGSKGTR